MLLFRSEDEIDAWCQAHNLPRGGVVPIVKLADMAPAWYGDRLDPDWRPRTTAQTQAILDSVGLTGPFWQL